MTPRQHWKAGFIIGVLGYLFIVVWTCPLLARWWNPPDTWPIIVLAWAFFYLAYGSWRKMKSLG